MNGATGKHKQKAEWVSRSPRRLEFRRKRKLLTAAILAGGLLLLGPGKGMIFCAAAPGKMAQ